MTIQHTFQSGASHPGPSADSFPILTRTALVVFLGAGAVGTAAVAAPQDVFDAGRVVPGALGVPSGVAVADIDGDGRPDVLASEEGSGIVVGFRDRGGADFATARILVDVGSPVGGFAVGDIDSDGDADLVVATASRVVSAWRNDGAGEFTLASQIGFLLTSPGEVRLVDVNGDGALDALIVTTTGLRGVEVLLGDGAGSFAAPASPVASVPTTDFGDAQFIDADQDGDLDLFVRRLAGQFGGQLLLIENNGAYPLQLANAVDVSSAAGLTANFGAFSAFDADGDGDVDVALSLLGPSRLAWIANLGGGAFSNEQTFGPASGALAQGVDRIFPVDYDANGQQDFVLHRAFSQFNGELRLVRSLGGGAFEDRGQLGGVRQSNVGLAAAVLDGSSLPSLISASGLRTNLNADPARVEVYPGTPLGFGAPGAALNLSVGRWPLVAMDVDQDGLEDVISFDASGRGLVVLRSLGDGTVAEAETIAEPMGQDLELFAVADASVDGLDDILYLREAAQPGIYARLGQAGGGLGPEALVIPAASLPPLVERIRFSDLNADGATDLLLESFLGVRFDVALNRGDGSFDPARPILPFNLTVEAPLIFGDVDGDGDVDLLVGLGTGVNWLENDGSANFALPELLVPTTDSFLRYNAGDVDGDGTLDIAYSELRSGGGPFSRDLVYRRGLGGLQFGPPQLIVTGADGPFQLLLEDVDLDGRVDVIFSEFLQAGGRYRLALATGSGNFAAPTTIGVGSVEPDGVLSPAFVDLNGDGAVDLAFNSFRDGPSDGVRRPAVALTLNLSLDEVGVPYCDPAAPNASGASGVLSAFGSERVEVNRLTLRATQLPVTAPGYLLASLTSSSGGVVPGSIGTLCLAGAIGRFVGPGQIQFAGAGGAIDVGVDLRALPQPFAGLVAASAGETWNFQVWYRDQLGGAPTSNFTSALALTLR